MPTLRFHGFDAQRVKEVSHALVEQLALLCAIPQDHFNLEIIQSQFVAEGEFVEGFPIVEVHAFARPLEVEDEFAAIVARFAQAMGYPDSELYFIHLNQRNYYGNGAHY